MEEEMSFEELQNIVSVCLDEIIALKKENEELRSKTDALTDSILNLIKGQKSMLSSTERSNREFDMILQLLKNSVENVKYEIGDSRVRERKLPFCDMYKIEDTVDLLVREKKSMARFGDAEFAMMCRESRWKYQRMDERLAKRLAEVIQSDEERLLIGIADNYGNLEPYNGATREEIRLYMTEAVRKMHAEFLQPNRRYHNAYITRPYAIYEDNATDAPKRRFENLKRIWDGRNVIFVEGALSRLGVGNDLFANAASIRRIEAPPTNSFDRYDEILEAAVTYAKEDTLFLIALGPSAGVLAYDLCKAGYQGIDVGHVDLEYEWYLQGKGGRCEVKHKYNNELAGGDNVEDIQDAKYEEQILCVIE